MNEGDSMATTVEQLKQAQAQNRELLKEIKALTATVQTLTEEVAFFQRQLFGKHLMTAFPFTPFGIKFYPIKRRN